MSCSTIIYTSVHSFQSSAILVSRHSRGKSLGNINALSKLNKSTKRLLTRKKVSYSSCSWRFRRSISMVWTFFNASLRILSTNFYQQRITKSGVKMNNQQPITLHSNNNYLFTLKKTKIPKSPLSKLILHR